MISMAGDGVKPKLLSALNHLEKITKVEFNNKRSSVQADINKAAINREEGDFNKSLSAARNVIDNLNDSWSPDSVRTDTFIFIVGAIDSLESCLSSDYTKSGVVDEQMVKGLSEIKTSFTSLIQKRRTRTV